MAKAQELMPQTYELQAPGKNPQTFIYYEDEATWLMISTNKLNQQIYFVAKEPAHTLVIIQEPFVNSMPLIIKEDIVASDEMSQEEYTLIKKEKATSAATVEYELRVHRVNQVYQLTVDPSVAMTFTPHSLYKICPELRQLGLITQIERPDGAIETLVERENSPAVVAGAIEKVQTVLADESYININIMYDDYGVSSFRELAEKMRAQFKEMGY